MTHVSTRNEPCYLLRFTPDEVATLNAHSVVHYDPTCRALSSLGGKIFGMINQLTCYESPVRLSAAEVELTNSQLQLFCKVLENASTPGGGFLYFQLRAFLRDATAR